MVAIDGIQLQYAIAVCLMQGGRGIEGRHRSSADTLLSYRHTGRVHHHVYIPKHDCTHIPLVHVLSKKEERYIVFCFLHIHCHLHDQSLKCGEIAGQ